MEKGTINNIWYHDTIFGANLDVKGGLYQESDLSPVDNFVWDTTQIKSTLHLYYYSGGHGK